MLKDGDKVFLNQECIDYIRKTDNRAARVTLGEQVEVVHLPTTRDGFYTVEAHGMVLNIETKILERAYNEQNNNL